MAATDFFTVEVLTALRLVRYFVLFVIDLETSSRRDRGHRPSALRGLDEANRAKLDGRDGGITNRLETAPILARHRPKS